MILTLFSQSRDHVRSIFGMPSLAGDTFDTFAEHGLIFNYGSKEGVYSIRVGLLKNGVASGAATLGVRIDDSVERCFRLWGKPFDVELETEFEYRKMAWKYQGYLLE